MDQDKIIELKAELTYWYETAEYNQNKLKEQKTKIYDLENENEELERNLEKARQGNRFWIDKYQELIKQYKEARGQIYDLVLDKQELEDELIYWKETAEHWKEYSSNLEKALTKLIKQNT